MTYSIEKVTTLIGARRYGAREATVGFLLTDSRSLCFPEETLFFALKSQRRDGHSYIADLYRRGVRSFVVETLPQDHEERYPDANFLKVTDSREALQRLAERHRDEFQIPIVGITGSNGKTTTTSLIYHIFKKAGYNVGLAGNIGQSLALQVAEKDYDYYVIELSSFQLDNMYRFRANIAVLLNITPDHLDRYDHCMQNYVDAKMRILQNQEETDAFVYWNDDPIIRKELEKYQIKAKKCPFSILKKEGMIGYLADGQYVIEYPTPFNMEQESLALTGKHNMYNSLAAGITADIAGVKNEVIRQSLGDFEGVEHRLEKVVRVRGVDYINDSKATNVDACWYALESMKTPTVLILGGKDKGNDYEAIAELVRKKCVGLVFLGADNRKLHDFFDSFGIPIADTHSMKDCVEACYRMARPGDTVLLSPCCASFDLFKNMEDRGEQFKSLVRAL